MHTVIKEAHHDMYGPSGASDCEQKKGDEVNHGKGKQKSIS